MADNSKKKSLAGRFILQGGILALSGILVRIIGMLYRIPMVNIIGSEGNGIYGVAYNIYNIALVLSAYGMPMAVSKLVSARIARKEFKNVKKIFITAIIFSCISGGAAACLLFFGAGIIESVFYSSVTGLALPLKVLAPTVFIVAVLGVFRGFFQGQGNMVPTAVSQLVEQIVNAIVSIVAPIMLMGAFIDAADKAAYGAAGGTLGTCMGALAAILVVGFIFLKNRSIYRNKLSESTEGKTLSTEYAFKIVTITVLPIILGQTFYNVSAMLDDMFFSNIMGARLESSEIKVLIGNYSTCYTLLISIPQGIASAFAASLLPSLVSSYELGEKKRANAKLKKTVRITMMVAIPCVFVLFFLGEPIIKLLFSRYDSLMGANELKLGGVAIIFYALTTIYAACLQAIGKMKIPVINSCISLAVHIPLVLVLLTFTDLGVYALVIGVVTFSALTCILNLRSVMKYTGYVQEVKSTFIVHVICSAVMVAAGGGLYLLIHNLSGINWISIMLSLVVCVIVYFYTLIWCKRRKYY